MPDIQETIDTMGEALSEADLSLQTVLYAVLIVVVGIVVIRVLMIVVNRMLQRSRLHVSIKKLMCGGLKFVLGAVLAIIVLSYLNVEVTSLVALLSVAALAVSLALQNLLSNVAGGLLLLSTKPFSIGDFVEAGSVSGTVSETGIFYTKLNTIDNKVIQIPNNELAQGTITNYSVEKNRRVDIKISVSYDAPVEQVKACIRKVLEEHPKTLADPEPLVRVNSFGDNAIEYILRVWCANPDYWDVYFDVLEGVKAAFDRDGIEMTYPHVNVHMIEKDRGTE